MKVTKIPIPIYHGFLRIVIADCFSESAIKLKVDNEGHDLDSFGAFVSTSKPNGETTFFNVFFNKDVGHDLIAHEVVHLVNAIYIDKHIKLDPHNDEPQAYLTGWITEQIYKTINK